MRSLPRNRALPAGVTPQKGVTAPLFRASAAVRPKKGLTSPASAITTAQTIPRVHANQGRPLQPRAWPISFAQNARILRDIKRNLSDYVTIEGMRAYFAAKIVS
ncbi:hypothetical protein A8709_09945 [Paenibacillus pectinilyticus]|uniref:Uncharacterized protein n=1 Tax=Paenibacillus pectinilyticus TaxID=512399 RepID=A0A1C1A5V9_9BACL|nr:hypothetical protein A8709_09945 [Paenibacillus pectinilyticus]